MILTVDEIKKRITPVAQKYELRAVYLFGSYARNEATEYSDVDILIDRTGSKIKGMFDMGGLYDDLRQSVGKDIDIVTTHTLEQENTKRRTPFFVENLQAERIQVYDKR